MAINQHPSRPLISLVPIRPAPPIVFSDMGIIISPSLLFSRPITNLVWIGHNILCCPSKICISIVFNFSWDLQSPQEKLKLMLMQIFGQTTKSVMVFLKMACRCRSAQKWNACFHTGINWNSTRLEQAAFTVETILNRVKLNFFQTCSSFGVNVLVVTDNY